MNEHELFAAALEIDAPAERSAYLDRACGGDDALRARIEALLRAHQQAGSFLVAPPVAGTVTLEAPKPREGPGTVIGPYKLLQTIGEGGMGTVSMAEQTHPVRRLVALKLIKAGMDSRQVLARFDAERQALALMDHPNIAKVLDAGATPEGRPYFVMELVKGVPITRYCDDRRLTLRQRLELFVPVCQAVQHAHQKGVIHRDLKPSNILVTQYDGRPVPKVIDFGVAKATGPRLTEQTLYTEFGSVVGTLEYMSPEQAELNQLDIDTRSDVYSLGAILYELLTGSTPLGRERLKTAAFLEMLRIIREEDSPRPSTRLSTTEELPTIAACRQVEPRKLSGLVRGELDWIVMKALEKDRNRRYETASALAADVQRYLTDEPVQACPPSAAYRFRKFARRHRAAVLSAGLVILVLGFGIIGTSWGLFQAERARAAEKRANEMTKKRLAQIEKSNEVLFGIFADLDIQQVRQGADPLEAVLADRLVTAARQLDGDSVGDPLAVAALQERLGLSLVNLGFPDRAIPVLEQSRKTRQETLGSDHPATISSLGNVAYSYLDAGKLDLAAPLFEEVLGLAKAKLGPDHPDTLNSMSNLADCYHGANKLDLALPLYKETIERKKAKLGPDHPDTLRSMNNLAMAYEEAGKFDLSLPLKEETLRLKKAKLGLDHPSTLAGMANLAEGYRLAGKLDLALPLYKETIERMKVRIGLHHPGTLATMNNLGLGYKGAMRLDLALPLVEETLGLMKAHLPPGHPNTLKAMGNLADCYRLAGKPELALPLFVETLKLQKAKFGPDHPSTLMSMGNFAACYWSLGQLDQSLPLIEEVVKRQSAVLGRQHPETLRSTANLGVNYKDAGRLAEALPLLEEGYLASKKNPNLRWVGAQLLDGYARAKKTTEATALVKELLDDARRTLPPESPALAGMLANVGAALLTARSFADAEPLLRECLSIRERKEPDDWTTFNTRSLLGGALLGQDQFAAAEPRLLAG
jgi:serine/threonine protein kinase/tetratricopeptide (TPR) repeat protein